MSDISGSDPLPSAEVKETEEVAVATANSKKIQKKSSTRAATEIDPTGTKYNAELTSESEPLIQSEEEDDEVADDVVASLAEIQEKLSASSIVSDLDSSGTSKESITKESPTESAPVKAKVNLVPECSASSSDSDSDSESSSTSSGSSSDSEETDNSVVVKANASSSSTSSSSSVSLTLDDGNLDWEEEDIGRRGLKCKVRGELDLDELPPIEELTISVSESECTLLGQVSSIVETLVVVQSLPGIAAIDLDTILFLDKGERPLGKVFDVIGPVHEPIYCIRFNSGEDIQTKKITIGLDVYCALHNKTCTNFVVLPEILRHKGSDASWQEDIEPDEKFLDYSDDEQERLARKNKKQNNVQKADKNGAYNPNFRAQTPTRPYGPQRFRSHVPPPYQVPASHVGQSLPQYYPPPYANYPQYYPPVLPQFDQRPMYYTNPYAPRFYSNPYTQGDQFGPNFFSHPPPPPPQ